MEKTNYFQAQGGMIAIGTLEVGTTHHHQCHVAQ
jgi:hypothetical protein